MINMCLSFKVNLCIYKLYSNNTDNTEYKFSYETIMSDQLDFNNYNSFIPTILIGWINSNHYELLFPINHGTDLPDEYINIHKNKNTINNTHKINNISKQNIKKDIEPKVINNNNFSNTNNNEKNFNKISDNNISYNESNIKQNKDKYKDELSNYVENKDSIYPKLKGCISPNTR